MNYPSVKPKWSAGENAVYVGDRIVGYFVRIEPAVIWAKFEAERNPNERVTVSRKGQIRYVAPSGV